MSNKPKIVFENEHTWVPTVPDFPKGVTFEYICSVCNTVINDIEFTCCGKCGTPIDTTKKVFSVYESTVKFLQTEFDRLKELNESNQNDKSSLQAECNRLNELIKSNQKDKRALELKIESLNSNNRRLEVHLGISESQVKLLEDMNERRKMGW